MSTKIINSITKGILKLNESKEKYDIILKDNLQKKESFEMMLELCNEESEIKMRNLKNKVSSIQSRIEYIDFIIKQLKTIENFNEINEKLDFNNHCLYFGTKSLYYSNKFIDLPEEEIFETILNHIIYYTGSLYIINNKEIRMSYILTALCICYGYNVNFKDGKNIFKKFSSKYKYKVIDINDYYRNFVIRNNKIIGFFKDGTTYEQQQQIYLTYRIVLGNNIKLKNMKIKIDNNNKFSVSEVDYGFLSPDEKNYFFKLA